MFSTYERLGVHIYASNREVIRAASKVLQRSAKYSRKFRKLRHQFYRQMIEYHLDARNLAREFRL